MTNLYFVLDYIILYQITNLLYQIVILLDLLN